jgi:hypothetical protein
MKNIFLLLAATMLLSACFGRPALNWGWLTPNQKPSAVQSLGTGGQSAASLDRTSAEQRAIAASAAPAGRVLGIVSVGLGSPAETGFWLKTNLVSAPANGRAMLASGAGVNLTLLPSTGPAQLSLSAYRALGLGLTDLPQVQISVFP